jgi:alpha-D-xyloside xylohydrolase
MPTRSLRLKPVLRQAMSLLILLAVAGVSISQARANIAIQNGSPVTITHYNPNTTAINTASFTVTAEASVMVVILETRNTTSPTSEPASLSWNGTNLTRDAQSGANNANYRSMAIYHLNNPPVGSGAITGTFATVASDYYVTVYTLSGVNTGIAPLVGSTNSGTVTTFTALTNSFTGVTAGSWAAIGSIWGAGNLTLTAIGTGGTALTSPDTVDGSGTSAIGGAVSNLNAGTIIVGCSSSGPQKGACISVIFTPLTINITAASASPNPVLVGSPAFLSVTTASTAGSITNVVVNASAIGGSSSLPLNLSAGNVYTNSLTPTLPSAGANLPVTVQDNAGDTLVGSIPVSVQTTILQDGSTAIITNLGNSVTLPSFTVTPGADVLVVLVEDKGASAVNSEPATLAWGSQTILLAVAQDNPATALRGESIYYLFNPTPGTNSITATVANSPASVDMTAYTLSGVNTNVPPLTGSGGDSTAGITLNVPGVAAGSCAAFNATWAAATPNPTVTGTGGTTTITNVTVNDGQATTVSAGYISGLSAGANTFAASWTATGQKNNFAVAVFAPWTAINITAASASPNPVSLGLPVFLSVTAASGAGSITNAVIDTSAIGGPSALPLNLSAGNVYTNSVTAHISSIGAMLPVTVQDNAGNTLVRNISLAVNTTNIVESSLLRLAVYQNPFSFTVIEKSTGTVLLQQAANQFTIGSTYGVTLATNFVITSTTLDADLFLSGSSAIGHVTFNFIQPGMIQTTLSSSNSSPSQIFQQFEDQGEDIFGGFEGTPIGSLSTRNFSAQLARCLNISPVLSDGGHAPFYLTTRHYGIYAETDALGTLTFAQGGYTSFSFNVPTLTYDIIYGTDYATIMAGFSSRSGGAYMPPTWAFDSIWWKDDDHASFPPGVTNAQGNVLDTASKLAQYQIHASGEWIDRPYGTSCGQGDGGWGKMDWDMSNTGFNNPAQMVSTLQTNGINLMLWISDLVWCDLYNEALADGYLFYTNDNSTVNLQNTNAFIWFQTNLNNYVNIGIKGYKIDRGDQGEMPDAVNNRNDTLFQQMAMQGVSAAHPNDSFVFSRTVSDTGRRYSALWNGDTYSTFISMQYSIINGLRAGVLNFPMWGSDTGGYQGGNMTEELFDRWFEFSTYCPIMEVEHGNGRTPWYNFSTNFTSPTNIVFIAAAQAAAHHDLIPYSRSWLYQATQTGMPVMRPIMFGYPNDTNESTTITNCEYLFGPNILVAPVVTAGATSRAVYLPADHWLDYNTKSNLYAGSTTLTVSAPIQTIPLFVREGAIIPRGDILQGNNMWTSNWSPSLRIEFFPSDNFNSTFPYYTGSSDQTISCSNQNQSRVIQFGDLGNSGVLQIYVKNPGLINLNGTNLNLGTDYTYNPTNNLLQIPFAGATTVVVSNSSSLFNPLWPSSPHITTIGLNGTGLSLSATNGTPSGPWALLQSTNVALPLNQWQTNATGNFDGSGNLSTNLVNTATNLQQFYILKVQ